MASPNMVSFTDPYATEQAQIERNRRLAQALQQQADTQLPTGTTAGGYFVATNPLQYLAQAIKGYGARKGLDQADQAEKDLQTKATEARSREMMGVVEALKGTPSRPQVMGPDDMAMIADQGGDPNPVIPAKPGDPNQAALAALGSQFGDIRSMAPGLMNIAETRQNRAEDRDFRAQQAEEAHKARLAQIEMQAREGRITREEADRRAAQAREDMIRLTASLRPAPQPQPAQIITTDTGIFERNRDGSLRQLTDPGTGKPLQPKPSGNAKGKTDVQATMDLYTAASNGLVTGLEGSTTGPIAGRLPAMTTEQQVAEGGVAAMAPVLKQLFRVAGEGTFTDKDQALLLEMVPTRKDTPEARQAKVDNIDNIVSAKLGIEPPQRAWRDKTQKIGTPKRRASDMEEPPPGAVRRKN